MPVHCNCKKVALKVMPVIVIPVSIVVSVEINRRHYFQITSLLRDFLFYLAVLFASCSQLLFKEKLIIYFFPKFGKQVVTVCCHFLLEIIDGVTFHVPRD